uniref:transposase n=1 Tax=Pontibacter russatus TaxID=2694929 RepID=UPI003742699F
MLQAWGRQSTSASVYLPDREKCRQISREEFERVKAQHWQAEECFRTVKQECHAQHFLVRQAQASQNHLFCVLRAYRMLTWMSQDKIIGFIYVPCSENSFCKRKESSFRTMRNSYYK